MKNIFFTEKQQIGATNEPIEKFWRGGKSREYRSVTDIAKEIRSYVKEKYPTCKFSVTTEKFSGGQSLYVSLISAPFNPLKSEESWQQSNDGQKYYSINQYNFEKSEVLTPQVIKILKDVRDFYNQFNYNESDSQSDYFSVGFYENISIGRWDKGFVQTSKATPKKPIPSPIPEKESENQLYKNGSIVTYKTSKGSEIGEVLSAKFIPTRNTFLYKIKNPRGGQYNIFESNIISKEELPETPTPEWQPFFNFKDIVYNIYEQTSYYVNDDDSGKKTLELISFYDQSMTTISGEAYDEIINNISAKWQIFKNPKNLNLAYINVLYSDNANLDTKVYDSWRKFQDDLDKIEISKDGYDKTKILVVWENGKWLLDRLDIGEMEGDFNPKEVAVNEYLRTKTGAFFGTNIKFKYDVFWSDFPEKETPMPETESEKELNFKVGDVFRRNFEGEEPPNTKLIYEIKSIGNTNCDLKVTNLQTKATRERQRSLIKIQEEIETGMWVKYEPQIAPENNSLQTAIEELKETNNALYELYIESNNTELKKEIRQSSNDNNSAIKEFSADLYFNPEKFLNEYFDKATEKIDYDNTPLSDAEFDKIVSSKEFINWFGDFNKGVFDTSPALYSKVITNKFIKGSTGKLIPQIVYHGTWNKTHFSRFKFNKFPITYFATNKSYAEFFAKLGSGIMYECFLDIKFLCDFRPLGLSEYTWNEMGDYLRSDYGIELPKNSSTQKQKVWAWIRSDAPNFILINAIKDYGFTGIAHIENNPSDKLPTGEDNTTTAYMIFAPEQAKLVRYVSSASAFTDIFFMKKGGKVGSALLQRIKNFKL